LCEEKRKRRKTAKNVIISGFDNPTNEEEAKAKVEFVLKELNIDHMNAVKKVNIVGKDGSRKIRATLTTEARTGLLQKARLLRSSQRTRDIFVNKDLTPAEQELAYRERLARREELKRQQEAHPDKRYIIRGGKVVEDSADRQPHRSPRTRDE
jgi:hypothetical protein